MFELKRIDEIAKGLTLGAGTEFLAEPDRKPIDNFNESVIRNAAEIRQELEWEVTLEQASGLTHSKLQKMREDRQSKLLTLLQQRVKLAGQRRALIQGFEGLPQANCDAARAAYDKAWQAAEKALRKAGISDAVESVFKVHVRQTQPVREAQFTLDAANSSAREFSKLRSSSDTAGEHAAHDLIEFTKHQLS